eukprot:1333475-Prymnesium_polylepis.1
MARTLRAGAVRRRSFVDCAVQLYRKTPDVTGRRWPVKAQARLSRRDLKAEGARERTLQGKAQAHNSQAPHASYSTLYAAQETRAPPPRRPADPGVR